MLARQDFFVRYRRATFGVLWAVALPLVQAGVLALVLSTFVRFELPIPFVVFVYAGTSIWSFFNSGVAAGSTAIADGRDLSTKIYFPRAALPLVRSASNAYSLVISMLALLGLCLVTGTGLGVEVVLLVPAFLLALVLTSAFGLVFGALHVYFRDVRYIVTAALLAWFYATPVFYPLSFLEENHAGLATALSANPVSGVVVLSQAAVGMTGTGLVAPVLWTIGWSLGLLVVALVLYARFDRVFVDLL